jgi:hypothetical protein
MLWAQAPALEQLEAADSRLVRSSSALSGGGVGGGEDTGISRQPTAVFTGGWVGLLGRAGLWGRLHGYHHFFGSPWQLLVGGSGVDAGPLPGRSGLVS